MHTHTHTGAFGYFEVTHDITKYCKAKVFERVGKRTPIAVRFSTVGECLQVDCMFIVVCCCYCMFVVIVCFSLFVVVIIVAVIVAAVAVLFVILLHQVESQVVLTR